MELELKDKVAIVAGGARGCGRAIAERLALEGARVLLTGRDAANVSSTAAAIREIGGDAQGLVADMVASDGAAAIANATRAHFGEADILVVNSPGPIPDRKTNRWRGFDNTSDDDFELAYAMFVMSQVRLARAVLPAMRAKRWGRLVNIGSIAMKTPHLEDPMPATNIRVAVAAVMKTLAQEYGPYGITANTIATGPFDSELSRDYRASGTGVKTAEWYASMLPIGRWGEPREMGDLVAFLCSARAGFITGETIRIDGGYTKSLF
jgi:3-oxoacyl-[acyl-carrier protein] reductase